MRTSGACAWSAVVQQVLLHDQQELAVAAPPVLHAHLAPADLALRAGLSLVPDGQLLFTATGMKAEVQARFHYDRTKFPHLRGQGDVHVSLSQGDVSVYTRRALQQCQHAAVSAGWAVGTAGRPYGQGGQPACARGPCTHSMHLACLPRQPAFCTARRRPWAALEPTGHIC